MRYIICDLRQPSHSGECEFGWALERRDKRWFWLTDSAFARPGSTTLYQHFEFELPKDFFQGLNWQNFGRRLSEAAPGCGVQSCTPLEDYAKDKAAIEALFC